MGYGGKKNNPIIQIDNQELKTQLAQNTSELDKNKSKTPVKRKTFALVIDDDGRSDFISAGHFAVLQNHPNAKMSLAINPNQLGGGLATYLSDADINTLKNSSQIEFVNHGWNHQEPLTLTVDQIKANYELEKAKFIEYGLSNYDYYVYPGYTPPPNEPTQVSNADLKNRLRQVYKCCLANAESNYNFIPFEAYEVRRNSAYSGQVTKDYIDWCIENGAGCVLFGHAWMESQTAAKLDETLTYLDQKVAEGLIEYVTVKEMVDKYSNIIEVGNGTLGADYFFVDKNGNANFSVQGKNINEVVKDVNKITDFSTTAFSNEPLTDYPINSVTIEAISYSDAIKWGLPDAGIIKTIRYKQSPVVSVDSFHEQTYIRSLTGEMWTRFWKTQKGTDCWYPWLPITQANCTSTARPRYSNISTTVFDTTLNKPIWSKSKASTANKTAWAASTVYNQGDVLLNAGLNYLCVTGGTSGASAPVWDQNAAFSDGTVTWVYVSTPAIWVDATGTTV